MAHELPPLPYDYAALEPVIDEKTMHLHHDMHHAAYVKNLNTALEKYPNLQSKKPEDLIRDLNAIPEDIRGPVRNNGGGHVNHAMFWQIMKPKGGGDPVGPIAEARGMTANVVFDREVEDTASALLRFEAGACGVLSVSHAAAEPKDSLHIFGSLGSIRVSVLNEGKIRVTGKLGERYEAHPPHANLHAPLIEDFVKAVLTDRAPAVSGATGRAVALIEEEIYAK